MSEKKKEESVDEDAILESFEEEVDEDNPDWEDSHDSTDRYDENMMPSNE